MQRNRDIRLYIVFFILGASLTLLVVSLATTFLLRKYGKDLFRARALVNMSGHPGPWGIIEPIEIPLANPNGVVPDQDIRFQNPRWFFENCSESELNRFIRSSKLEPYQKTSLLDHADWTSFANGVGLYPPEPLIWSLSPEARGQIYSKLAQSTSNYSQCFPFRFLPGALEPKLQAAGLHQAQISKVRQLTYTNEGYECLTDLECLRRVLKADEFKKLMLALYVTPTYFLRVRIPPGADLEALARYWGKGGREKRILPIIDSIARAPAGTAVNVSYLMPTFARLRLYTYPEAWNDPTASKQDCFFTTMNFFNETPDTNFFSSEYSLKVLNEQYEPINDAPVFGDIITVFTPAGEAVHTCIYLADDFVFTKNGVNASQPWVIMRLPDMLLIYSSGSNQCKIMFSRRKMISAAAAAVN